MALGKILGAGLVVGGAMMQKSARKKQIKAMAAERRKVQERYERQAANARSSFRGTLRSLEAQKTASDIQFTEARSTAARLQKSALQNRQLARRGGLTPEAQAQMLGMGNMQEYLAQRAGRMENVQRITQLEAGIVSQQQQVSADILKTGAGAESVWSEAQAGLMSKPDEMGAALAGMGSAMMGAPGGGAAAAAPAAAGGESLMGAANSMGMPGLQQSAATPMGSAANFDPSSWTPQAVGAATGNPMAPAGFGGPGSPFQFIGG